MLSLKLGGENHKILDNFTYVVKWVAVLVFNHQATLLELVRALGSSSKIRDESHRPREQRPFSQLAAAESNMCFLADLFNKGLGSLDAVLGQFDSVESCSAIVFDAEASKLTIEYTSKSAAPDLHSIRKPIILSIFARATRFPLT